jgi:predicted GIY-YIG superfamily endonuclease
MTDIATATTLAALGPAPRRVRNRRGRWLPVAIGVVVAAGIGYVLWTQHASLVSFLLGAALIGLFVSLPFAARSQERRLLSEGEAAPAVIIDVTKRLFAHRVRAVARYEFHTREGTLVSGELMMTRNAINAREKLSALQRQRLEQPIAIYDPKRPENNRLYPFNEVDVNLI